ncbi:MAG TPA: MarR family transcriptional regulator [Streptosporangiaceae bacterium]|jgi:DNA-binding MarR family transcriptional regulator
MPAGRPTTESSISPDVIELERALTRIAYLITRTRRHDRVRSAAGVSLDRAAVVILRQLADSGPLRPGELASRLEVEAPHVTRQVQRLQQEGYVDRVPDPGDRRAQVVRLTPAGRAAVERVREVGRRGMEAALATWTPRELHQLATLFHRMVDDFLAYMAVEEGEQATDPVRSGGG